YVQGVIAAKLSKVGVAGYIGSFPIPEVVQGINSFMLGAQSVNPNFKVKVIWANAWFDPARKPMPPRLWSTRASISSPSIRIRPR
ncbi:BMP family ABC transporter substrate-binding protein, partial [Serratia marcescens]